MLLSCRLSLLPPPHDAGVILLCGDSSSQPLPMPLHRNAVSTNSLCAAMILCCCGGNWLLVACCYCHDTAFVSILATTLANAAAPLPSFHHLMCCHHPSTHPWFAFYAVLMKLLTVGCHLLLLPSPLPMVLLASCLEGTAPDSCCRCQCTATSFPQIKCARS